MRRYRALLLALLLLAVPAPAQETGPPELEIFSRFGSLPVVKVFDDEPVVFFARRRGGVRGALLRNVRYALLEGAAAKGGRETVLDTAEDEKRWGRPPSSYALPIDERDLPPGRYRLRATRAGWKPAEIGIVVARFGYYDLDAERDANSYRASFNLRLVDVTETRRAVPVEVRVESLGGGLVDSRRVFILPVPRDATFEGRGPVRLSSAVRVPDRERPERERAGTLRVVPGCRLVLVLDGIRFPWPVPLPAESR